MTTHPSHAAHLAFAGAVAVVRPSAAAGHSPAPYATPAKAMWRKATAVDCTTTGLSQAPVNTIDGTDLATRRPPGGT